MRFGSWLRIGGELKLNTENREKGCPTNGVLPPNHEDFVISFIQEGLDFGEDLEFLGGIFFTCV